MTTKDEALRMAMDALKLGAAMYSPAGTAHAQIAAAIAACREALAQKDEQEPVAAQYRLRLVNKSHVLYVEGKGFGPWRECNVPRQNEPLCYIDSAGYELERRLLYAAPPKRQPLTDAQRYALIEKHLGLEQRKNATVIDHRTGRWTDAARYFDLMDAAIETANGTGEQT